MALLTYPKFKAFYTTGIPLAGGLLYTYLAGTVNTPQAAYSDIGCTVPLSNPVVLDTNGEAVIYLKGAYKLVLTDSTGLPYWTLDNIQGIGSSTLVGIENYGNNLNAAIAAIGSTPTQLLIDTAVNLTANAVVPSTLGLMIVEGGSINDGNFLLTINGPFFVAGNFQWSFGANAPTFGSGVLTSPANPAWWGGGGGGVSYANAAANIIGVFAANSATPDLSPELPVYVTANTTATTITDFANKPNGYSFKIIIGDIYTTINFTGNITGHGGANWSPNLGDVIDCVVSGAYVHCTTSAYGACNVQTFSTSGTWTKPPAAKICVLEGISGGGGGGTGTNATTANIKVGGGGGGGGAFAQKIVNASDLPSTLTCNVGTGGSGNTVAYSGSGGTGGATYIINGSNRYLYVQGGNGGANGAAATLSVGGVGGQASTPFGSVNVSPANAPGTGCQGGNGFTALSTGLAQAGEYGGGGGGGAPNSAVNSTQGAGSLYGGGGGGGGGNVNAAGSAAYSGGPAELQGGYGNADTGGPAGGNNGYLGGNGSPGQAGQAGSSALGGGSGGGGGGGSASGATAGGAGGNGGVPGGGGGGGGAIHAASGGGLGGDGGAGLITIITYF